MVDETGRGAHAPVLSDLLGPVLREAPPGLLNAAQKRRLLAGASLLPPLSALILEVRLTPDDAAVDLSVGATAADGGRSRLAGFGGWRPPEGKAWQRVAAYCRAWRRPGSLLNRTLRTLWLELDLPAHPAATMTPSVFIEPEVWSEHRLSELLRFSSRQLRGNPLHLREQEGLSRLVRHLPRTARTRHAGFMVGRPRGGVRLTVSLRHRELPSYLRRIGARALPADGSQLAAMEETVSAVTTLHCDLSHDGPRSLGLEVRPASPRGWPRLLDQIAKHFPSASFGALTAWADEGVLESVGYGVDLNVRPPRSRARLQGFQCLRGISHLKLPTGTGTRGVLKAYLHVGFLWPRQAPRRSAQT